MQQLSHTLAKVKRLIVDGEWVEANQTAESVLAEYYGTGVAAILETPAGVFRQQLAQQRFVAEELARLADFIDLSAQLHADPDSQRSLWQKVILLYDILEQEHQTVSFDHIMRRTALRSLMGSREGE